MLIRWLPHTLENAWEGELPGILSFLTVRLRWKSHESQRKKLAAPLERFSSDDWITSGGSAIIVHFSQNSLSGQEAHCLINLAFHRKQQGIRKTVNVESVPEYTCCLGVQRAGTLGPLCGNICSEVDDALIFHLRCFLLWNKPTESWLG